MFHIPLIVLKFLALLGFGCLIGMVLIILLFGPEACRFARKEWPNLFSPNFRGWYKSLGSSAAKALAWLNSRDLETEAYVVLAVVFFLLCLGIVIRGQL